MFNFSIFVFEKYDRIYPSYLETYFVDRAFPFLHIRQDLFVNNDM
jgi:hypothetical protein